MKKKPCDVSPGDKATDLFQHSYLIRAKAQKGKHKFNLNLKAAIRPSNFGGLPQKRFP